MQTVGIAGSLAEHHVKQPAEEADALLAWRLDSWRYVEALPERLARSLFTVAEQRPTDASLVVLRPRQRQRQQQNTWIVFEIGARQLLRPVRIVAGDVPGQASVGVTILQALE